MQHTPYEPMTTRMSTKGQVVIPRATREMAGLKGGTELSVRLEDGGRRIVLEPSTNHGDLQRFFEFCRKMRESTPSKAPTPRERRKLIMDVVTELDERTKTKPHLSKRKRP